MDEDGDLYGSDGDKKALNSPQQSNTSNNNTPTSSSNNTPTSSSNTSNHNTPTSSSKNSNMEERRTNIPRNNRILRSSVRPFLCCGSQLSLNSLSEFIQLETTVSDKEETEFTDLSDCDEVTDLMANMSLQSRQNSTKSAKSQRHGNKKKGAGGRQRKFWTFRKLSVPKMFRGDDDSEMSEHCVCTSFTKTSDEDGATGGVEEEVRAVEGAEGSISGIPNARVRYGMGRQRHDLPHSLQEFFLLAPVNFDELYPIEDIDEQRIAQRRREMEEGIEISDIWVPQDLPVGGATNSKSHDLSYEDEDYDSSFITFETQNPRGGGSNPDYEESLYGECTFPMIPCSMFSNNRFIPRRAHSTVDFIHCLVPDILQITKCSFYWGVMDRYQAEKLLEQKPEGTFLLRDSAQDDYLFSVSFRRYGRSLHARIEQWNHKFSFDSHDPGVFASDTVCGLIEHYKDPSSCMFFEPMLTLPLHRNVPFSLQHLCRATISNYVNYDSISQLPLPKTLKEYMRYYHYKQKIRMRTMI